MHDSWIGGTSEWRPRDEVVKSGREFFAKTLTERAEALERLVEAADHVAHDPSQDEDWEAVPAGWLNKVREALETLYALGFKGPTGRSEVEMLHDAGEPVPDSPADRERDSRP